MTGDQTQQEKALTTDQSFPVNAFLLDGRAVRVQGRVDGEYVVQIGYEDDDGEIYYRGFETADRIFEKPPTEAYDKTISDLQEKERQLRDSVAALRHDHAIALRESQERMKFLQQHEPLKFLEDFLKGNITHFVVVVYGDIRIRARDEALKEDSEDRWNKDVKLLTLFGKTNGGLQWRLNRYSDGSGSNTDVYPCCSADEARTKALELLAFRFEEFRQKEGYPHGLNYAIDTAKKLGVEVPADIAERWAALKEKNKRERIAKLEEELAKVRAEQ